MRLFSASILFVGACCLAGRASAQCPGDIVVLSGGIPDDFAMPNELSEPSEVLQAYADSAWVQISDRPFDAQVVDRALIHTFAQIPPGACGATLELHLLASSDELTWNDSVRLELLGGPDPVQAFMYWTTIRNAIGSWGPGSEATFVLDLANLPPYGGFPTNLLGALSDGSLDLLIEDDTAVDYALLRACYCENATHSATWGHLKSRFH